MSIVTIGKYKNRRITSLVFSIGHLSVIHDTHMGNPVSFDTGLTTENFFFLFCSRLLFFFTKDRLLTKALRRSLEAVIRNDM